MRIHKSDFMKLEGLFALAEEHRRWLVDISRAMTEIVVDDRSIEDSEKLAEVIRQCFNSILEEDSARELCVKMNISVYTTPVHSEQEPLQ